MGRTRRQPPLYEVLSSPSRRLGGSAAPARPASPGSGPVPEMKPGVPVAIPAEPAALPDPHFPPAAPEPVVRVHAAHAAEPELEPAMPRAGDDVPVRISATMLMVGLGALIIILAAVWAIAFQMGQKKRENELGVWQQNDATGPVVPAPDNRDAKPQPLAPPKPDGSGNPPRKPDPAKPEGAAPAGGDPRVPGFNYLYLGTLTFKDASAGVDFLKRNGLQAFHVVDRSRPGGNNPPCRIYASQGYPGGPRFKETEKERAELVRRVEELGKKWQREEKGASDFRQPYWTLHKEP